MAKKLAGIPATVPYCHKNYEIAKELANIVLGNEEKKPNFLQEKTWEKITEDFKKFSVNTEKQPWETVEDYFTNIAKSKKSENNSDIDSEVLASINTELSSNNSKKESNETILDLTNELLERETKELAEQTLKYLKDYDSDEVRNFKNVIDAAISAALTRKKGNSDELPDYKTFSSQTANIKEYGRLNEKVNYSEPLRTLGLYKTINQELTTIKSKIEAPKELYIMIDDSGSMDTHAKKAIVNLVLMMAKRRTLDKVLVKVFFFESELYDREYDLSKEIPQCGFNGGSTDVETSLTMLFEKIQSKNASILVVNDGQDAVSNNFKPVCRMVALTLFEKNKGLENAANKSGGKYYSV